MQHRTIIRAMLIGVTALGAWTAAELADDTAAHADTKLPAVVAEQLRGPLDHRLPERASDRAKQVVDQVAPDKPATAKPKPKVHKPKPKPPVVKPAPKPEPAKPAEPKPRLDVELPPVVPPATDEPTADPAPAPDAITFPTGDPAPLPDADDPPTLPGVPVPPAVVVPAPLPILVGPTPTEPPPAGIIAHLITSLTAAPEPDQPADCADDPRDAVNVNRVAIRALLAILTGPATNTRATPAHGCPGTPGNPLPNHADCAGTTATSNTTTHGALAAMLAGSLTAPALIRLAHARPRSSIPAGRHTAIEPGPA